MNLEEKSTLEMSEQKDDRLPIPYTHARGSLFSVNDYELVHESITVRVEDFKCARQMFIECRCYAYYKSVFNWLIVAVKLLQLQTWRLGIISQHLQCCFSSRFIVFAQRILPIILFRIQRMIISDLSDAKC